MGQVGVESAEVDAVLQRKDISLVVQLQAQLGELAANEPQHLPCRTHVWTDRIPVVHIHTSQRQVQLFSDIVHNAANEENGVDVAGLVAQGQPVTHSVDELLHQRLQPYVRESLPKCGL